MSNADRTYEEIRAEWGAAYKRATSGKATERFKERVAKVYDGLGMDEHAEGARRRKDA